MSQVPRKAAGFVLSLLLLTGTALAQTATIEGTVKGEDGQPVKDAFEGNLLVQGQGEGEGAALTRFTFDPNLPSVMFDNLLADC